MKYKGITQQPISWDEWSHLVTALAQHAVQRYGAEAVRAWHFEVWSKDPPFSAACLELHHSCLVLPCMLGTPPWMLWSKDPPFSSPFLSTRPQKTPYSVQPSDSPCFRAPPPFLFRLGGGGDRGHRHGHKHERHS